MRSVESALDVFKATGKPLISITGPSGVGRTTLLAQLSEELTQRGSRVSAMRFTPGGDVLPARFALRPGPAGATPASAVQLPGPERLESIRSPIGPVVGACDDPEVASRAAAAAAAPLLRDTGEAALLIDDAQWIDRDSLAVLEALTRRLAGSPVLCICSTRTPVPGPAGIAGVVKIRNLRRDGLAHSVRLRTLTTGEIARQVTTATLAAPDAELVAELREISRGLPAALHDSIRMLRENGSIQVIDQRAYLTLGTEPACPPRHNQLVRAIRDLGATVFSAAKAVAVLSPLGAAMPRLVSEILGKTEQETIALLEILRREGILHRGRAGRSWRFPVPLVTAALTACLGPFERRQLAAKAVTAVWTGAAECEDPDYFADQVADAGRLLDPRRALGELLRRSASIQEDNAERALRWLGAAVDLAENRAQRAMVMLMHTSTCHLRGDYEQSLHGAQLLLNDFADQLSPDANQEVQVMAVCALSSVGDTEALREIVEQRRQWAGGFAQRTVTRALACGMLDRWSEVDGVLSAAGDQWRTGNETSAMLGAQFSALSRLWTGHPDDFERSLAARTRWPLRSVKRHRIDQVNSHLTALLLTGDLKRAEKLLSDEDLPTDVLRLSDRAMIAALGGKSGLAVDLTRRSIADRSDRGYDPGTTGMHQVTASVLVSQGKLKTARDLLAAARATTPMLSHLLDVAEAQIDRVFGANERAASRIKGSLEAAATRGLVIGAEISWAELADLALESGDPDQAQRCLTAIEQVAKGMQTGRAWAQAWLVRATVGRDRKAAAECLRSVRERGQPFELAVAIERLVKHGVGDPKLLNEAYEIFGGLDALLYRAWLRNLMRVHAVTVPGRQRTVAENEYLLALLAAEGLSNKQLATVLRTSDKSVEGRLSRLFTRTGYRSRIELSTAMLNGEFVAS